jgi:D-alanine-D-alanine ligase
MKKKIRVGILFGGKSAEHEVSVQSAKNVYQALDKEKYEPVLIGIDKQGLWHNLPSPHPFKQSNLTQTVTDVISRSGMTRNLQEDEISHFVRNDNHIDVIFPVLHGPYGEDGTIQGFLKLLGLPFVGAGVLGSAVGMDKDVAKRLLRDAGLPVARFLVFIRSDNEILSFESVKEELGLPFFVKPANLGSSIGVSRVHSATEFEVAVAKAFAHDAKILIEEGINAREIECSVLGNEEKITSVPGEIIPSHEFYDYDAKYIDESGAKLEIPAKLTKQQTREIQHLAVRACEVLCVDSMARVDFFIDKIAHQIYVNEINTIPGFTNISMYPKLWEASGIGYTELIDRLIQLALDREKK